MSTIRSQVAIGIAILGLNVVFSASAVAQVCSRPTGTYETFGDTVVDTSTKLAWKRCSGGQTWNGTSCSGQAALFTFDQALALSAPSAEGFVWRIPRPEELATLVIADGQCPVAIDQEIFPRSVPGTYWTGTPVSKAADAAYCQSFSAGASASDRQSCWAGALLPVRLVSALPVRGRSGVAPTASAFAVEDSGNYLVVLGSNFSQNPSDNVVNFPTASGVRPVVPESATGFSLRVKIPTDTTTGTITVTTRSLTSQPAPGTLRVINNKEGCVAAGFTPATIASASSTWDYCILPAGFKDQLADVMVIGAHPSKLAPTQPNYVLATSPLGKATTAAFTLSGTLVLQYGASGSYGALTIVSNAGQDADTVTNAGTLLNNGLIDNRGNFTNLGSLVSRGNGVILNAGVFTNNPGAEKAFSIETTGTAINSVSFSNASAKTWPRAQLKNMGALVTLSGSTGIENFHGDIVNRGTMMLQGAYAFTNRSGSAPGTVINSGTIQMRIVTQPEGVPIVTNEPGATITNAAGGTIVNAPATWTFANGGTVQNCGTIKGATPIPVGYSLCPPGSIRR